MGFRLPEGEIRDQVRRCLEQLLGFQASPLREDLRFSLNRIEEALLWCHIANPLRNQPPVDPRIREALNHMAKAYGEELDIPALARACGLSPSRFAHLFRAQTSQSPMKYLERIRMIKARELILGSDLPISKIAVLTGYREPFYFSQVFRRHMGQSPARY
ncbi:MAG: helix-turn-helix domain-containing protein, partial [Planctomycetes bacterium]|nr:helix-turn-helix domain-containing protein [Planctomycetota bacterium]